MDNIVEEIQKVEITPTQGGVESVSTTTVGTSTPTESVNEDVTEMAEVSDRTLAYIEKIVSLEPIQGADVIEIATVLGWRVIVKKGLYNVGDLVVYVEIDSILPPWPYFICDKLDKCNFKVKTMKMRGQISQGYCIPIKELLNHPNKQLKGVYKVDDNVDSGLKEIHRLDRPDAPTVIDIGTNLTEFIGIKKVVDNGGGGGGGNIFRRISPAHLKEFPAFLRKSDQPRIQNLPHYMDLHATVEFEVTEKLEGSSITAYYCKGVTGICSRNYELRLDKLGNEESEIVDCLVKRLDLLNRLNDLGRNIALQGELVGPKIQGNIYGLPGTQYKVYDIFLIDENRFATHKERVEIMDKLTLPWNDHGVPFIGYMKIGGKTMAEVLELANGFSLVKDGSKQKVLREGLVFKSNSLHNGYVIHFKSISNQYLLKKK